MKVSIIGATGYSGLELIRYLHSHSAVEIVSIHSQTETQTMGTVYPYLKGLLSLSLEPIDTEKIMAQSELVFLALPSGVSKEVALPFVKNGFPVIDLSGDFRLKEKGMYEKWYKKEAVHYPFVQSFDYGLAEYREDRARPYIANPGCYATAAELSFAPLLQKQLVDLDSLIIDGKSGLSGAGKALSQGSHFTEANENMSVYKMNEHQHIPEIHQQFQRWAPDLTAFQFTTALIPVTRGIFMTGYAKLKEKTALSDLLHLYQESYKEKKFVRIQNKDSYPVLKQVIGTNFCDIGLSVNEHTGMVTLVTVIDNLGKGAAGQAVQNLNILKGYAETEGLLQVPIYP